MNAKKLAITLAVVVGLFMLVMMAAYFYRIGLNSSSSPQTTTQPAKTVVTDKAKIPSLVTGTISAVDLGKLTIKQFASFDLDYQLNKADVGSIVNSEKNPQYDPQKFADLEKEMADQLTKAGIDPNGTLNQDTQAKLDTATKQKLDELTNRIQNEPALKQYVERTLSWDQIKIGAQANYETDANGKTTLRIFPPEINIGPPTQQQ